MVVSQMKVKEKGGATKDKIKKDLATLGLVPGDTLFFHSSLKSIGYVEGGPDAVIDAFLETLGKSGTLVLPALSSYDWENMSREEIEKNWSLETKSTFTGLIPETFRKRVGTVRSDNPTHSVTAIGRYATEITKDHKDVSGGEGIPDRPKWASRGAFGENSPWDKLYALDARYMFIGVDFSVCTMLHHVQVIFWEDYLQKIDRNAPWPTFDFGRMGKKLEALGLVRFGKIAAATARLISARALVDTAIRLLREESCGRIPCVCHVAEPETA